MPHCYTLPHLALYRMLVTLHISQRIHLSPHAMLSQRCQICTRLIASCACEALSCWRVVNTAVSREQIQRTYIPWRFFSTAPALKNLITKIYFCAYFAQYSLNFRTRVVDLFYQRDLFPDGVWTNNKLLGFIAASERVFMQRCGITSP